MSDLPHRARTFFAELRRRKVIRVAIAYGIVALAVIEGAGNVFPHLQLPPWTVTFVVVMAIVGFPIALLLSWAYDLTPDPGPELHLQEGDSARKEPHSGDSATAEKIAAEPDVPKRALPAIYRGRTRQVQDAVPNNLPVQPTVFVGREKERREIAALLRTPSCRLITVIGTGGVGKTRLALEAAAEAAASFPEGVYFVPLSALATTDALLSTIFEHIGLTLASREDPRVQLVDHLRDSRLLLVLDNFEHLTGSAHLLAEILEQAPGVKIIATSRERLNLHGEVLFPIDGLSYPQGLSREAAEDSDAVQLFVQNAQALDPRFSPAGEDLSCIVRIAQLVEGIPLAIELASAWVRVLSCAEIVQEIQKNHDFLSSTLRDVPDRHKSLRAAFDSSWRLLTEAERRVFRRLSIFRGGFTRDAAEKVAGADFATLSALLDKSLVRRAPSGRFEVPEVLRQYAVERLKEDPLERDSLQQLHCEYYEVLLRRLHDRLNGDDADEKEILDRIGDEIDNIRKAGYWAITHRKIEKLADLLDSVFAFYDLRGRAREGEEIFRQAQEAIESQRVTGSLQGDREKLAVLAKITSRHGVFCMRLGRHLEARELIAKGLALARELNDREEIAFALERLGTNAFEMGQYQEALPLHEESLAIARELQDQKAVGRRLIHLGNIANALGNYAEAKERYRESLALHRQTGDQGGIWVLLCNLGAIAGMEDAHAEARQLLQESLAITRELDNKRGIANSLVNLGCVAADMGEYSKAQQYLRECIHISREMGYQSMLGSCLMELGNITQQLGNPEEAAVLYRQALAVTVPSKRIPVMLEILFGISQLLAGREDRERAVELLSLILEHPASDQNTRNRAEAFRRELAAELSHPVFERAAARGRALELEEVISEIRGEMSTVVST